MAFVGGRDWSASITLGGGSGTGWFPLGPREAYLPSYRTSREYFTQINVSNTVINTTTITNVYNNYSSGRIDLAQTDYINRGIPGALTAVPNDVFVNAKPVRQAQLQLDVNSISGGEILRLAPVAPSERSVLGLIGQASAKPDEATFNREVIARNKPAADTWPFSEREQRLQRNPGMAPESSANGNRRDAEDNNVLVISPTASAVNARELGSRREGEKPNDNSGKPVQLKPLDRSVEAEASLKPQEPGQAESPLKPGKDEAAENARRDDQERQQQIQRKEEQSKEDERQQQIQRKEDQGKEEQRKEEQGKEEQRKETERQQNANAQVQRDEQARQEQGKEEQRKEEQRKEEQGKEEERQRNVNAQTQRDEQERQQQIQRKEEQGKEEQRKEEQRKNDERQQNANAQVQREEQERQQQIQRKEEQGKEEQRKNDERQQNENAQAQREEQTRQEQQQQQRNREYEGTLRVLRYQIF